MSDFSFGHTGPKGTCCPKPQGCRIESDGCIYKAMKAGDQRASDAYKRQGFRRALVVIAEHRDAEVRARNVAIAVEQGREIGECPLHGQYVVEHGPAYNDGAFDCMTREGCDHRELREYAASLADAGGR